MKAIVLLLLTLAMIPNSLAQFSKWVLLSPADTDARHRAYHPTISQNSKSADFVDVRIPWVDDGKSYWLALASSELEEEALEFRAVIRSAKMPPQILAFSPLARQGKWTGGRYEKRPGYIELTLHKSFLDKAYIYHDFSNPFTRDGGFYYTIKLSEYPVKEDGTAPATSAADSDPKSKTESNGRSR